VPPVVYHVFVHRWIEATAVIVLGVALSSGPKPWLQAASGAFKPPDFASDIAAARVLASGSDPYEADVANVQAGILNIPAQHGYPYFPHPPLTVLVSRPLAHLPFSSAAVIWFAASLGLLFALAVVLAEIVSGCMETSGCGPSTATTLSVFASLLVWPPVLYNLEKGQWSIVVSLLLALAWRCLERGKSAVAGACIGGAAAVKVFPVILGGYLLPRAPRAVIWFVAVGAIATLLPLTWMGPHALSAFMRQSQANVAYWETWPAVTYSLHGAAARLLIGGEWAQPLVNAPILTRYLVALASVALVGIAMLNTGRERMAGEREGARFATWTILLVTLNPLAMGHNGVVLALPIALTARALLSDQRIWPRLAWAAGVVLVSIPRQTIVSLAPVPVPPWQGLAIIALPLWGTMLLFGAAIGVGHRPASCVTSATAAP
jgi:hypothetical protein